MKAILIIVALISAQISFAGPEDHAANQTCYAMKDVTHASDVLAPVQICLENLSIDTNTNTVSVYSYFMADLFKNLNLVTFDRKNENGYKFVAVSPFVQDVATSNNTFVTTDIVISGLTDNYGETSVTDLKIQVLQTVKTISLNKPTVTATTVVDYTLQ